MPVLNSARHTFLVQQSPTCLLLWFYHGVVLPDIAGDFGASEEQIGYILSLVADLNDRRASDEGLSDQLHVDHE